MKVLVIGAFGTIGRKLVPELIAQGHQVAVSSRHPDKTWPWPNLTLPCFKLDLLQIDSIAEALTGIEVVYYLMHGMSDGEHHSRKEHQAASNLITAAEPTSVRRIIYVGSLVSNQPKSEHMKARVETGRLLAASSIAVTEVRAGIVVASGSAAFEVMRDMVGHVPVILAPSGVRTLVPPIAIANLIYYLVELLELPESEGQCFDAAGPEWLSYQNMMERISQSLDQPCRVFVIPGLPLWLAKKVLAIVTSVPRYLAKALIAGLNEKLEANPEPLRQLIPQPLMPLEQAVDAVLAEEQVEQYPEQWQDGVPTFRNFSPLHGFYAKSAKQSIDIQASTKSVWAVINLLGGRHRYFYLNSLWALREWMDWAIGGPGRNHGRTNTDKLNVGEQVDSWRILSVQKERRLVMKFGMKAPGGGGMQISLSPSEDSIGDHEPQLTRLSIELLWHPAGFWGLVYWYFYSPWHQLLLKGMTKRMKQLAEQVEQGQRID